MLSGRHGPALLPDVLEGPGLRPRSVHLGGKRQLGLACASTPRPMGRRWQKDVCVRMCTCQVLPRKPASEGASCRQPCDVSGTMPGSGPGCGSDRPAQTALSTSPLVLHRGALRQTGPHSLCLAASSQYVYTRSLGHAKVWPRLRTTQETLAEDTGAGGRGLGSTVSPGCFHTSASPLLSTWHGAPHLRAPQMPLHWTLPLAHSQVRMHCCTLCASPPRIIHASSRGRELPGSGVAPTHLCPTAARTAQCSGSVCSGGGLGNWARVQSTHLVIQESPEGDARHHPTARPKGQS